MSGNISCQFKVFLNLLMDLINYLMFGDKISSKVSCTKLQEVGIDDLLNELQSSTSVKENKLTSIETPCPLKEGRNNFIEGAWFNAK